MDEFNTFLIQDTSQEVTDLDDTVMFNIINRTIMPNAIEDIVVKDDNNSRTIKYRIQRLFENVDLSTKSISFRYTTPDQQSDESFGKNITVSGDSFTFEWKIDGSVTHESGLVEYDIMFYDADGYKWHTKPATLKVEVGLNQTTVIPQPSTEWIDSWREEAGQTLIEMRNIKDEISDDLVSIQNMKNDISNAIKGSKSEKTLLINDISSIIHDMGVKVRRKNLFDVEKIVAVEGVKDIIKTQNSFSFKKISIKRSSIVGFNIYLTIGTYFISGTVSQNDDLKGGWALVQNNAILINKSASGTISGVITITTEGFYDICFYLNYNSVADTTVTYSNIQLELGSTATDYTPYVQDLTAVKVNKYGKNIYLPNRLGYYHGNAFDVATIDSNGKITLKGTSPANDWSIWNLFPSPVLPVGKYKVSSTFKNISVYTTITRNGNDIVSQNGDIDLQQGDVIKYIQLRTIKEDEINYDCTGYVQLEVGETATEYEPYKEPITYTPNADGTVDGVMSIYPNMTLATDNNGIIIDCEYNKDANKVIEKLTQAIIALGGSV